MAYMISTGITALIILLTVRFCTVRYETDWVRVSGSYLLFYLSRCDRLVN